MSIDPFFEIYIGFFIALGTYVLVRFNVNPPICLCAMGGISFILGITVTMIFANPENALSTIVQNTILFIIGNALGMVGGAIFEGILRGIGQIIQAFEDVF